MSPAADQGDVGQSLVSCIAIYMQVPFEAGEKPAGMLPDSTGAGIGAVITGTDVPSRSQCRQE